MFKWLEKFLARPYEKAAEQAIIDKTEKPKDISEPVIAIVKTFDEKGRWTYLPNNDIYQERVHNLSFTFTDTKTDEKWRLSAYSFYHYTFLLKSTKTGLYSNVVLPKEIHPCSLPDWMTREERNYVARKIETRIYKLSLRLDAIETRQRNKFKALRELRLNEERQRLMDIYINE